jgi:hypothetical protein
MQTESASHHKSDWLASSRRERIPQVYCNNVGRHFPHGQRARLGRHFHGQSVFGSESCRCRNFILSDLLSGSCLEHSMFAYHIVPFTVGLGCPEREFDTVCFHSVSYRHWCDWSLVMTMPPNPHLIAKPSSRQTDERPRGPKVRPKVAQGIRRHPPWV